jgi:hypothetical protein
MPRVLVLGCLIVLGGCSSSPGSPDKGLPDLTPDLLQPDKAVPDLSATNREPGQPCTSDGQCKSSVCNASTCAKLCATPTECATGQDCGSDDGKRIFCYDPTYDKTIGTSCAVSGKCPTATQKCFGAGAAEDAGAYCTDECTNDTTCPPATYCREASDKKKYCFKREFCNRCLHDGQCGAGNKCIKQGSESFCSQPCTLKSTECPRFADCKDIGGEGWCVHKSGSCVGKGTVCEPCNTKADCEAGAACLTFTFSQESFCATDCSSAPCTSTTYACQSIPLSTSETSKLCVPADEKQPKCVSVLSPTMEVGDIIEDFAMVGYKDTDGDASLLGEQLQVVHLSDFAKTAKIILFNVSAGWCGPCQEETKQFVTLNDSYGSKGLLIFQTLFDSDKQGTRPSVALLNAWVKAFKPTGACGIDPARNSVTYNTDGTTPLNLIVDAKTRKVLEKFNAFSMTTVETKIKTQLGL